MKRAVLAAGLVAAGVTAAVAAPTMASAAVDYFDVTRTVTGFGSANCPYGWEVTGGGIELPNNSYGSTSSSEYALQSSYPTGSGWRTAATKVSGRYSGSSGWSFSSSSYSAKTYAVCVK